MDHDLYQEARRLWTEALTAGEMRLASGRIVPLSAAQLLTLIQRLCKEAPLPATTRSPSLIPSDFAVTQAPLPEAQESAPAPQEDDAIDWDALFTAPQDDEPEDAD